MSDNEGTFTFVWKIVNFSMLPHQEGEYLESPTFVVDTWKKVYFNLRLFPRDDEEKLSLYLHKMPEDLNLKLNFTLSVESIKPSDRKLLKVKDRVLKHGFAFKSIMNISSSQMKLYLPQDTLTVQCEISPVSESSAELNGKGKSESSLTFLRKHCVSRTCIQLQKRSIMWSIQNVKEHIERPEKTSFLLTSAFKNSPSLKLTLNFNKATSRDDIPILIAQTGLASQSDRLFVKCKITVASTRKVFQISKTSSYLFDVNNSDVWSFPPFLTANMLTEEKSLCVNNTLLLRCEFSFSYKSAVHHSENTYMPFTFSETRQRNSELSNCFNNIYSSGKFCDVKLKAGGRTFQFYKVLLCARSPVFCAMFENDMKEKSSNIIKIDDVEPDTLQRMLTYLHSDVLPEGLLIKDAISLYEVANKYDLGSLKERCSVTLATHVSVENLCHLLVIVKKFQDSFLMTAVHDFICSHRTEVFHSAQWKSYMNFYPALAGIIMHKVLCHI